MVPMMSWLARAFVPALLAAAAGWHGQGAAATARPASAWPIHPDSEHPLLSASPELVLFDADRFSGRPAPAAPLPQGPLRTSLRGLRYAPLHQLLTPPHNGGAVVPPSAAIGSFDVPVFGAGTVDRGRLVFPQGQGARLELRMDRPAAAFVKRF
jgi:hypothetical protein